MNLAAPKSPSLTDMRRVTRVCVHVCVCACVSKVECGPHRAPGPAEPIGPTGWDESRGDCRECGAQGDERVAGVSRQTGAEGIVGLESP